MALGAPRLTSPRRAPGAAFLLSDRPAVTQDGQCAAQHEYSPTGIGVKMPTCAARSRRSASRCRWACRRWPRCTPRTKLAASTRSRSTGSTGPARPDGGRADSVPGARLGAGAPRAARTGSRRAPGPRCEGGSRARVRRAAAAADTARTEAKVMAQVVVGAISDRLGLASSWETVEAVTPAVASTQGSRGWSTEERRPRRAWRDAARTG
jgi:hypothetical protein